MKIGIVCHPTFGGSGVVATELGLALAEKGHEVHFISYKQPARLTNFILNVFFHEVQMDTGKYSLFAHQPYEWALTSKIVQVVEYYQLDFLHVHYAIPHASAAYMAQQILADKGYKIPFLTTLHGTDITLLGQLPIYRPVIQFAIQHSDAVTCVSESLKKDTLENFNLNKEITVIPNFINTEEYKKPILCDKYNIAKENEFVFIHISNFRKVKRVQDVIEIFDRIQKEVPAKLLMLGDGPEKIMAEELVMQKKIAHHVHFLGNVTCVPSVLSISDIFLLPSEQESFGLSALEAFAAGCPVISSNAGGLPEVNQHGKTGFLSAIGDVKAMAEHALYLVKNPDVLKKFKQHAKERAKDFELDKILPLYQAVYQKISTKSL